MVVVSAVDHFVFRSTVKTGRSISMKTPRKTDKRWVRTRGAMMEAGTRLFSEEAPEGVTIDEIVLEADIAKGSFYNHFDDKEGYTQAVYDHLQDKIEIHIANVNAGVEAPPIRIVRALYLLITYTQQQPREVKAVNNLAKRHTRAWEGYNQGISQDITDGISAGVFKGISVQDGVLIGLGIISVSLDHAAELNGSKQTSSLALSMGAALLRALGMTSAQAMKKSQAAIDSFSELEQSRPAKAS